MTYSTILICQELEAEEQRKQDAIAAEEAARIKVLWFIVTLAVVVIVF